MDERQNFCREVVPADCRMLLFFIKDGSAANWLGYASRDDYIRKGLNLDPDMVHWALEGLSRIDPSKAIPFNDAVVLGKPGNTTSERDEHGKFKRSKPSNRRDGYGTTAGYTLARLERDHPELAAQVRAGTMTANAAAIAAGFRKRTWQAPADVDELAAVIERRFPGWRLVRE